MSTVEQGTENSNTREIGREVVVRSAERPRSAYLGPRPLRTSRFHQDQPQVPGAELRQFFGDHARKLANQTEQGFPVNVRELELLIKIAREIIAIEKAA